MKLKNTLPLLQAQQQRPRGEVASASLRQSLNPRGLFASPPAP